MIPLYESETPKVAAAVVPLRYQAATIIAKTLGGARMSGPMLDVRVSGGTPEAMVNYALRQFLRNPHTIESWHEAGKMLQLAQQMKIGWDESLLRPAHRKVLDLGEATENKSITIQQFVEFVCKELQMPQPKSIKITDDLNEIKGLTGKDSFGLYDTEQESVTTYRGNRHPADVLRTLAHELVHHKQLLSKKLMDGNDGSDVENEANAQAGVLMRKFSQLHPDVTRQKLIEELGHENEWGTLELVKKFQKATPGQEKSKIKEKKFRIISKEEIETPEIKASAKLYDAPKKKDPAVTPPQPSPAMQSIRRAAPMIESLFSELLPTD